MHQSYESQSADKSIQSGLFSVMRLFFLSSPLFELLFSRNGSKYIRIRLSIHQFMDVVRLGKTIYQLMLMFIKASGKITCNADI